jgi:orotate phosphoribosyltransferase
MRDYQRQFLELAVERGALRFGRFELKSGRISPYFFNIGALDSGAALADGHDLDRPWCFDRKEAKDHGEGGNVVGAPLAGRVVIVDDVLTAGTAVRQAADLIRGAGAEVAAVVTALDRQERGLGDRSAASEASAALAAPVVSIVTLGDVLDYLDERGDRPGDRAQIAAYRQKYGGDQQGGAE